MKRILWTGVAVAALSTAALATEEFFSSFTKHYKIAEGSALSAKSCSNCHVSAEDFAMNPYGKDLKAKLKETGKDEPDAEVFAGIESLDSDGDGTPNADEIKANTAPGDPASGGKQGVTPKTPTKKSEGMIPKNAFHPAIVHFPIALFMAGLLLDALGVITKHKTMLLAGWYNLMLAALSCVGAIGSGLLAMFLKGYPFSGTVLTHFGYAVGSSVIMWILVAMRVDRHEKMNIPLRVVYYLLAFLALFLISWAGHVGGDLVYG